MDRAPEVVERFLARLHGRTRTNYALALRMWGVWLDQREASVETATRQDVEEWVAQRRADGISPRTVCTDLSHLAGLYRWMVETGLRTDSPMTLVRRPRYGPTARPYLSADQTRRLLAGSLDWSGGELAAHVHLWALSGLRPGEPRALTVGDLTVSEERTILRVPATKTDSRELITLPGSTARLLAQAADGRTRGPLLIHPRTGRPWTKSSEQHRLASLLDALGLPHVSAYGLRTGFITLALNAGIDERLVMISARHTSSAQTARYDRLRDQVERAVGPQLEQWLSSVPDRT